MGSVAVLELCCINLIFWLRLDEQYCRGMLLMQESCIARDVFVFQQDNAPAHSTRDTVELLRRVTPQFISLDMWPANSPDLNPVDYRIWSRCRSVYQVPISDTDEFRQRLVETGTDFQQSMVDDLIDQYQKDWKRVSMQNIVTINTC